MEAVDVCLEPIALLLCAIVFVVEAVVSSPAGTIYCREAFAFPPYAPRFAPFGVCSSTNGQGVIVEAAIDLLEAVFNRAEEVVYRVEVIFEPLGAVIDQVAGHILRPFGRVFGVELSASAPFTTVGEPARLAMRTSGV